MSPHLAVVGVIRINNAPAPAHKSEHLGSMTTLYVNTFPDVHPLNASRHLRSRTRLPLVGRTPVVFYCHVHFVSRCFANSIAPWDGMQRFSPAFVARVRDEIGMRWPKWPSTGAMAVAFAQARCKTIRLFGFGGDTTSRGCARYFKGSFYDCSTKELTRRPELCSVYERGATSRRTRC